MFNFYQFIPYFRSIRMFAPLAKFNLMQVRSRKLSVPPRVGIQIKLSLPSVDRHDVHLTFRTRNYFFGFSTPVYKMRIIQEPNTIEL